MMNKNLVNYIFFLKTSDELSGDFFKMAELFSKLNIVLLPISAEELLGFERHKKHQLIILRNDLASAMNFQELKKSYLDFAMSSGHITIYDITSFSEIENSAKYIPKKSYFCFPLPADVKQIVMDIAVEYFRSRNEREEWPGGRRSKIPTAPEYENKN